MRRHDPPYDLLAAQSHQRKLSPTSTEYCMYPDSESCVDIFQGQKKIRKICRASDQNCCRGKRPCRNMGSTSLFSFVFTQCVRETSHVRTGEPPYEDFVGLENDGRMLICRGAEGQNLPVKDDDVKQGAEDN